MKTLLKVCGQSSLVISYEVIHAIFCTGVTFWRIFTEYLLKVFYHTNYSSVLSRLAIGRLYARLQL